MEMGGIEPPSASLQRRVSGSVTLGLCSLAVALGPASKPVIPVLLKSAEADQAPHLALLFFLLLPPLSHFLQIFYYLKGKIDSSPLSLILFLKLLRLFQETVSK